MTKRAFKGGPFAAVMISFSLGIIFGISCKFFFKCYHCNNLMIITSIRMFLFIILILNEYKRFIAQATREGRNVFHIVQYFNVI